MAQLNLFPSHRILRSVATLSTLICGTAFASSVSHLQEQRAIYDQAQKLLDNKQVDEYRKLRDKIADYPLTPYVDYRTFLVEIDQQTPQQVDAFIESHQSFPFSNRIRAPYIDALAKREDWKTLVEFQQTLPKGQTYQCHYFNALYQTGDKEAAFTGAEKLWLTGSSIADACDPLFSAWDKAGLKSDELVLERMLLAFKERNGSLMNYLHKQLDSSEAQKTSKAMKALYSKPESVATFAQKAPVTEFSRAQTTAAMRKLARKEVELAQQSFDSVVKSQKYPQNEKQVLADYIAFRLINTKSDELASWRDGAIKTTANEGLKERRIRLAIQQSDWQGIVNWIELLPKSQQQSLRWQYWLGRSEIALGDTVQGKTRLNELVGQRNFYSVAAASAVQQSINYPTSSLVLDKKVVAPYSQALARIQELIDVDKIAAAKSEWRWLLSNTNVNEKEMLAAYAADRGWHHLTVTASISAKLWDNTQLRFPIAHQWWFNFYGEKHDIDPITLMSLARQESAMDIEARSPVGARGIMQIMPRTAKYTAQKYKLSYNGVEDLYEVGKNIEIGSHYLNGLLEQYDNNRIFALAAYNAGPHRVKQWRSRTVEKLDAYAFIESIPFNETRGYVQNILMFETYYRDLMGVDGAFLNEHEIKAKY
ncbi:murein transglycosylase [Vibrio paucivorans]|uniref:Murein transglycosylase n=1 Tax=Vibrio paucivorans TaxID=2829489 RepID=A0A9X3HSY3_9VIBR|nr:murein transglycosylase [Vibrio paucivorans]MCW8335203.1 murein transglycosylase [Vibrio paucivorans]